VEHASRLAEDARRLSTQIRPLGNLLNEAHAIAQRKSRDTIDREAVGQALAARARRLDRLRDVIHQAFHQRTLLIDTEGAHIGQVNGLAVTDNGDFRFAYPVRVTATTRLGDGDLVDIERESTLGGPIHSKGMMILAGFLGARYAQDLPLSLSASVVCEQSYGPIEGDSASLAEACALLSALSMLPVRQDVAITGSLNQFGTVQAVGGIHEKIEGFFDLCQDRGLSTRQGVIIPKANLSQLMLHERVLTACAQQRFHVWAVQDIDEALEILTGVPAGVPNAKGEVPVGTVNFLVAARLAQLSLLRQAWNAGPHKPTRRHESKRGVHRATRAHSRP
jgi:predicted ATP-dependent protease